MVKNALQPPDQVSWSNQNRVQREATLLADTLGITALVVFGPLGEESMEGRQWCGAAVGA